ncbi:hypothetical protein JCM17478_35010 [Thermopirellula anaerolimosa]
MAALDRIQRRILNAAADDYEDLEQIYRSISLTFSSHNYRPSDPNAFYWREAEDAVPLSEIIEGIRVLVESGLLSVRLPESRTYAPTSQDVSYLWRGWFRITEKGRIALEANRGEQG